MNTKKYINTDIEPLSINDSPWCYEINEKVNDLKGAKNIGKWMLFVPRDIFNEYWKNIKALYNDKKLSNIIMIKCSTDYNNSRASDNNNGVILLYCNKSNDRQYIINIGINLLKHIDCKQCVNIDRPYIYYKSDEQTLKCTRQTGSNKNHLYKLNVMGSMCHYCDVELVEKYKMCGCHLCEDWGGCKTTEGYYIMKCPKCRRDYEKTKTIEWNSRGRLKDYF